LIFFSPVPASSPKICAEWKQDFIAFAWPDFEPVTDLKTPGCSRPSLLAIANEVIE
jgi:hypothetical protein